MLLRWSGFSWFSFDSKNFEGPVVSFGSNTTSMKWLFAVFFWFQEFWPNSDVNSSFGSVPRRPNLSTQVGRRGPLGRRGPGVPARAGLRKPLGRRGYPAGMVAWAQYKKWKQFVSSYFYVGLVLGCIDADIYKEILIFELQSSSIYAIFRDFQDVIIFCTVPFSEI